MRDQLELPARPAPAPDARVVAQRPRRKSGPTIRDVASACGVSAMTVSAVLNDRRGEVSPLTRDRILQAIAEMDYHPSAAARALSRKRTETIGVVFGIVGAVDALANPYMSGVLSGVLAAAKARGYDVNIVTRDWISREVSARAFNDERTDGLLLIAPSQNSDIVTGLSALGRPLVTISGDLAHDSVSCVDVDDSQVAFLAVSHLLELGHRRIAHITGNVDLVSANRRLEGYRATLEEAGLPPRADYIVHAEYSGLGVPEAVQALMAATEPPSAIFCGNDNIAFEAIATLRTLGRRVPEDVSIVGVDDVTAAALVTPPLTTVRQPLSEIGFTAAEALIEAIDSDAGQIESHSIAPRLVVRQSTKAARVA